MNCGDGEGIWKKGRWTQCNYDNNDDNKNVTCNTGLFDNKSFN